MDTVSHPLKAVRYRACGYLARLGSHRHRRSRKFTMNVVDMGDGMMAVARAPPKGAQ